MRERAAQSLKPEMGRMGAEDPPMAFPIAYLVDTHLHLEELGDPGEVVEAAAGARVTRMITMGVDLARSRTAVSLAHRFDAVWAGVGHQPSETSPFELEALEDLAGDSRVAAIGEVGLDFEQPGSPPREVQMDRLVQLFDLAVRLDLPVSVHNRGASAEIAATIAERPGLRGVMHYFALEWDWAEKFLALGFYLSFAGLVTRPSRHALRDVVKRCPPDRLLLETDSPYGNAHKRMGVPNRPAFLIDTAELVAELRGLTIGELAAQESANAAALFRRIR
jgi:TatD DNase family protein